MLGLMMILVLGLLKAAPVLLSGRFEKYDRFTVVIDGEKRALLSISTDKKGAVVIVLPNDLYISRLAHGYGAYQVSKIYEVGELDHRGGEVFSSTLSQYLGIPVDGFIHTKRNPENLKAFFTSPEFFLNDRSNLSLIDRIKIIATINELRFDRIEIFNLQDRAEKIILADGLKARSIDSLDLDHLLGGSFVEKRLEDENLRVLILNSTKTAGLGNRVARLLSNIGMNVVNVDSQDQEVDNCQVRVEKTLEKSLAVRRILDIFKCQLKIGEGSGKSDLELVVGRKDEALMAK